MKGKIYLIPTYLSNTNDSRFISAQVQEVLATASCYLVENVRTARRFLSSLNLGLIISKLNFVLLEKDMDISELMHTLDPVRNGMDMVLLSEAGMPCIADPGNRLVSLAHEFEIPVVALQGSSSILLALVSSGFNGQAFTFHGYLPIDRAERTRTLRKLEKDLMNTGYTQLFMETPYRNADLFKSILATCKPDTHLFIGSDLGDVTCKARTQRIGNWKRHVPDFHKVPTMFALGVNA